jgi:hypothetical protein
MNEPDAFPDLPPDIQAYIRDLEARNAQLSARVRQLEEQFRLAQLKRYAPSGEKRSERMFNEAEQMGPEPQTEARDFHELLQLTYVDWHASVIQQFREERRRSQN